MTDSTQQSGQAEVKAPAGAQKIISVLVVIFCFVLFPVFIIYSSLNHLYLLKTGNFRQEKLEKMRTKLEYVEKYSGNSRYLHFLLLKIADRVRNSPDPAELMGRNIRNLKKQYPGDIEFIVWDGQGRLIKDLTDQKGYSYILGKLYEVLRDAAEAVTADNQAIIQNLSSVTRNLNLIRQFLGRIFIPDHLKKPYMQGNEAGPLLTDFGGKFSSVWYRMSGRLSFMCFLSEHLLNSNSGLEKIVNSLNRRGDGVVCGFSLSPDVAAPKTDLPQQYAGIVARALAQFENAAEPVFENDEAIISMSMPQPGIRTFCLLPKDPVDWSVELNRNIFFFRAVTLLLLFYGLLYVFFSYKQQFFSIRWKLTGLFLFANLAPLSILGFIAHDYLNSRKEALRNEVASDLSKFMRDFDIRYASLKNDFAVRLTREIGRINADSMRRTLNASETEYLKKFALTFHPSDLFLIASSGAQIFAYHEVEKKQGQNVNFIEPMCEAILKFCNRVIIPRRREDVFSAFLSPEDSDFVRKSYRDRERVIPLNVGNINKLSYWYILGDRKNYANDYALMIFWEEERFQELYIKRYFSALFRSSLDAAFFARSIDGKQSWPSERAFPAEVARQMERTAGFRENLVGSLKIGDQGHVFVGLKGKSLRNTLLAALYPDSLIDLRIDTLRYRIFAGALLSLLLTIIIGQVLTRQFLTPIRNLGQATLAIGARNFAHRVPIGDEDEFGHLNQVFNRVIEGLGELEVAKIVQESLFPGNSFKAGNFDIYGKSVVMTTLGGDYYDCLQIDDARWGLVIGDVAGHGVPAGLMMAMAKASVLMASPGEKADAALLTARLHKMFFAIKNDRLKRMMTFQYFVMHAADGFFSFANAGHCFPIVVRPAQRMAEFIEHVSTPLGIGPRARYKNFEFSLAPGEALILYTDGIAEAKNALGEEFGFERFRDLTVELYDPDPEVFYRRIYAAYNSWSAQPDDDLTIIVVNHKRHEC